MRHSPSVFSGLLSLHRVSLVNGDLRPYGNGGVRRDFYQLAGAISRLLRRIVVLLLTFGANGALVGVRLLRLITSVKVQSGYVGIRVGNHLGVVRDPSSLYLLSDLARRLAMGIVAGYIRVPVLLHARGVSYSAGLRVLRDCLGATSGI